MTDEPIANIINIKRSGFAERGNLTYPEIDAFILMHPDQADLRIIGEGLPPLMTAAQFLERTV